MTGPTSPDLERALAALAEHDPAPADMADLRRRIARQAVEPDPEWAVPGPRHSTGVDDPDAAGDAAAPVRRSGVLRWLVAAVTVAALLVAVVVVATRLTGGTKTPPVVHSYLGGAPSPTASPSATHSSRPTSPATTQTTAPATPLPAGKSSSLPRCGGNQLKVAYLGGQGFTQQFGYAFLLTNTSGRACQLRGYPGADATIHGITVHATRITAHSSYQPRVVPVTTLIVGPRQSAFFNLFAMSPYLAAGNATPTPPVYCAVPRECDIRLTITLPNTTQPHVFTDVHGYYENLSVTAVTIPTN